MNGKEFKEMCRLLKVYPVVVTEETVDKVSSFCSGKRQMTAQ